jgi:hypothetical protein
MPYLTTAPSKVCCYSSALTFMRQKILCTVYKYQSDLNGDEKVFLKSKIHQTKLCVICGIVPVELSVEELK